MGPPAPRRLYYPRWFKVFTLGNFFSVGTLLAYNACIFLPSMKKAGNASKYLSFNAVAIAVVLVWFVFTQMMHLSPCISSRVANLYVHDRSSCKHFWLKLLFWNGPMYLFLIFTVSLLCVAFISLANFQNTGENNASFSKIVVFGVACSMVGVFGIFLLHWHHQLIMCTLEPNVKNRMPLPAILDRFQTCAYEQVIGHGKEFYPAECAICLGAWQPLDKIKVTPCKHTFHEECISSWLKNADTCALCRLDVVSTVEEHKDSSSV